MSLLSFPRLAKCDNRAQPAKEHPDLGAPDRWFSPALIEPLGYAVAGFDFFVNWSTLAVANEIWIKRISSVRVDSLAQRNIDLLSHEVRIIGDDLAALHSFAHKNGFTTYYQIFSENVDWAKTPDAIMKLRLGPTGFDHIAFTSLQETMDSIRLLSGGPITIGSKGLFYGTSSLECFLSTTNALWPGDCDDVLFHVATGTTVAIIEYKKHTLCSPISNQRLSNYYPTPDGRKYNRLALLRDRLGANIPMVVVYYPTDTVHSIILVERVTGPHGQLQGSRIAEISYRGLRPADVGQKVLEAILAS